MNNGRHAPELANSVGMFVRTLPMAHSWDEDSSVRAYLQEFQRNFYETMEHDCISFGELAREYGIASDILFVYQGEMLSGLSIDKNSTRRARFRQGMCRRISRSW